MIIHLPWLVLTTYNYVVQVKITNILHFSISKFELKVGHFLTWRDVFSNERLT